MTQSYQAFSSPMPDFSDQVKTPPVQNYSQEELTGKTVGRFRIEERLGAGGMGEVYRAVDSRLHRTVAIKRMSWRQGLTPADHALFLREGQRASSLNHANIASIYDVIDENDEILLVMEYVSGSSLRKLIGEPMPLDRFFHIAVQCADALAAAHQNGILHGDVKPENIMLGPGDQVKLLDFGVARRLPGSSPDLPTSSLNTISASAGISGTPTYMAPEVLKVTHPMPAPTSSHSALSSMKCSPAGIPSTAQTSPSLPPTSSTSARPLGSSRRNTRSPLACRPSSPAL